MPGARMTSTTVCLRAWCFTSVAARASKIAAAASTITGTLRTLCLCAAVALLALAFVAAGLTLRQCAERAQ